MLSEERKAELRSQWDVLRPGEVVPYNTSAELDFLASLGAEPCGQAMKPLYAPEPLCFRPKAQVPLDWMAM